VHFALNILAALCFAAWLYLAFFRGFFWRLRPFDDDLAPVPPVNNWPPVVAIVPARNEAATIRQSLTSLLRQDYAGDFSIIVVDDHSNDATAQIARQAACELSAESRASIHSASALPPGWTGKLWSLNEGITQATRSGAALLRRISATDEAVGRATGNLACAPTTSIEPGATHICRTEVVRTTHNSLATYFWFTDADIVHAPGTLRRLVARAETDHLDLTSIMVLLQARTLPERVLIPSFLFFFLKLYPPCGVASPRRRTAGAAGGCLLLRREALERLGGLAAIRSEVIDDCALARAIKRRGGRIWMGLTRASVSLRSYRTLGEIRDMIARTAFTQLRYSPPLLLLTLAGMFLVYLVPVALLFSEDPALRIIGLATWSLMSLLFLPAVRFYRLSAPWSPLLPLAVLFYCYATAVSALRYYLGRGAQWKGRSQAPRIG
jgi:GT2 family glycosyltransferase